jgi:integrase
MKMKHWSLTNLVDAVTKELKAMGYKRRTLQMYRCYGFSPIMRYYESIARKRYSEEITAEYVAITQDEAAAGRINDTKRRTIRKTAALLAEYAKDGKIVWRALANTDVRQLTEPYTQYLENYAHELMERGYQTTTIRGQKPIVKHFLHYLEDRGISEMPQVSQEDILAYLPVIAEKYARSGDILSILRLFLSFMYTENVLNADFVPLLKVSAAKRRKYYHGFTKHEANEILSAADRETPCGKRNYAIIMLAARTGLRAIDVLGIRFGDIDWQSRELRIVQHKTDKALSLPLDISVCNAIADYILNGRPVCDSPHIFLRDRRPYRKLESWSGHAIVKSTAAKAGITWSADEHKGFHSFRRSLGNWMLEAEIPLSTISEILGHAKSDSTKPYIMTHHSKLGMCPLTLHGIETTKEELL